LTEDRRVDRDDNLELLETDRGSTDWPEVERAEPMLVEEPFPDEADELDEPGWLDAYPLQEEPAGYPPLRQRRKLPIGVLGSLCLHLLPLLVLVHWDSTSPEIVPPIPVQLVLETPPAPSPEPAPKFEKPPPPGRLASEEMGDRAAQATKEIAAAPGSAAPERTQQAAIVPPPPPKPVPPPPKPAEPAVDLHPLDAVPKDAQREPRVPGPAATRDEYLAYLVTLTRRHMDLLPPHLVGDRRGETVLELLVLADGTIAKIAVAHGSGYPEIDERIEQMVAAVRRFPPLPQWYQGRAIALDFKLRFPEALER
jgi:periplasmic protein TonB